MIPSRPLKAFKCRYHRNGVAGEGFYLCQFRWKRLAMQAVLFMGDEDLGKPNGRCAVIDPTSIHLRWRGDEFEPAIRALILAYGDKAFSDEQGKSPTAPEPKIKAE